MKYMGTFVVVAMLVLSGCSPNSASRRGSGPPENVEEESVVIFNPDEVEDIQRKTEELKVLLQALKAHGAKMHGFIELPEIDERCCIIDLNRDVE